MNESIDYAARRAETERRRGESEQAIGAIRATIGPPRAMHDDTLLVEARARQAEADAVRDMTERWVTDIRNGEAAEVHAQMHALTPGWNAGMADAQERAAAERQRQRERDAQLRSGADSAAWTAHVAAEQRGAAPDARE